MPHHLTPRQLEILNLIAKGLSNKEICSLLEISNNTVKIHVTGIFRALGVSNRTEAAFAYQQLLAEERSSTEQPGPLQLLDRLGRPAIALLPFENLQLDAPNDGLVAGLVEELLVRLSAWRWFPIVAYGSSRRFDTTTDSPQSIGADLSARYLIYGSLRNSGGKVRVTVRLVEAQTANEIWSRTFEAELVDLFTLQDEIATQIVTAMAPELTHVELRESLPAPHKPSTAWQLFCEGMRLVDEHTTDSTAQAIEHFDQAIATASDFGLALHGKVRALQLQLFNQWVEDREHTIAQIDELVAGQIALDPSSFHSQLDAGYSHILRGRRQQALDCLEKAIEVNPSSASTLSMLAQAYGMSGRLDEAIMHMEQLLKLDPRGASIALYRSVIGLCHAMADRYSEALEWGRDATIRDPKSPGPYLAIISAHVGLGDLDSARQAVVDCRAAHPNFDFGERVRMMQPFTEPELIDRLVDKLRTAGINL